MRAPGSARARLPLPSAARRHRRGAPDAPPRPLPPPRHRRPRRRHLRPGICRSRRGADPDQPDHRHRRLAHLARPALLQRLAEHQPDPAPVRPPGGPGRPRPHRPHAGRELEAAFRDGVGVQAPPRREVARRPRLHRRRRGLHRVPRSRGAEQPRLLRQLRARHPAGGGGGPADRPLPHPGAAPAAAGGPRLLPDRLAPRRPGRHDGRLQQRQGGDRHRPLPPVLLPRRRPHRVRPQRRLLARAGALGAALLPLHGQRRLAHRGLARRRRGHDRPGAVQRPRPDEARVPRHRVRDPGPPPDLPRARLLARRGHAAGLRHRQRRQAARAATPSGTRACAAPCRSPSTARRSPTA